MNELSELKKELRALRKKLKRVVDSRTAIKAKAYKKSVAIKAYQDREVELKCGRDSWKHKFQKMKVTLASSEDQCKKQLLKIKLIEDELNVLIEQRENVKKKLTLNA